MKKLSKKNLIILISIIVITLIALGGTITYFAWNSTEEDKDSIVDVTILSGTGQCSKLTDNSKLLIPTSSKDNGRVITMKASHEVSAYATITWNLTVNRLNTSATTTKGLKHESFKYELINTTTGVSYGSGNFSNINAGDTITFTSDEKLTMHTEYTFTLYLWIDGNWGINPTDMQTQTYDFDMNCTITGTEPPKPPATETISSLYTNATKATVINNNITYNYANIYDTDSDDTTSGGIINDRLGGKTTSLDDGNIRYYGANPNNYIYFNCSDYTNQSADTCEVWRIIGLFKDIELADGTKKDLIKIIRNDSIGDLVWDYDKNIDSSLTTFDNDWRTASLQVLLNTKYYEGKETVTYYARYSLLTTTLNMASIGLKSDATRNKIAKVTWNLGGWNKTNVYSDEIYNHERGTDVYSGRPTSWPGKIALMYLSDYGYATDFTKCLWDFSSYYGICYNNDWLSKNSNLEWLLTTASNYSDMQFVLNEKGNSAAGFVYDNYMVRPTLFLSSNQVIEAGDGSSTSPYQLKA